MRQNSNVSHGGNPSRSSRSHSPTYIMKQAPKRRNTMNSRDAAYEQEMAFLLETTAAEAAAAETSKDGIIKESMVTSPPSVNGDKPDSSSREGDGAGEGEKEWE